MLFLHYFLFPCIFPTSENGAALQACLEAMTSQSSVPIVFMNGRHVGGYDLVTQMYSSGELARLLVEGTMQRDSFVKDHTFDYDVIVIGGGSGGLSCAKVRKWAWQGEEMGWAGQREVVVIIKLILDYMESLWTGQCYLGMLSGSGSVYAYQMSLVLWYRLCDPFHADLEQTI